MSQVSCRACLPIVEALGRAGHSPRAVGRGLDFDLRELERPSHRIAWDDFVALLRRSAELLGSVEALREMGSNDSQETATGLIRALARPFVSARPLYVLGARWYGPSFFSNTRARCEDLPGGRLRQVIEILPPFRDSAEFFYLMWGVLEATPQVLGLRKAVVGMERAPHRTVYTITPPPSLSWSARVGRALRGGESVGAALAELEFERSVLEQKTAQLEAEIQERRSTEAQLEQLQRIEAVGLAAGGLAHEFANLLTAIALHAELAAEGEAEDSLAEIRVAAERGTGIVKRLLGFSRQPSRLLEPLDLRQVLEGMEPMLAAMLGEGIGLELEAEPATPWVLMDRGQLEQVIVNLAVNAGDAMPEGGALRIHSRPGDGAGGARAVLELRDEGCGMDERTRDQIFEPFFTTKARGRGTGLGLFVVSSLIAESGGSIAVESEAGVGTCFRIDWPACDASEEPRPLAATRDPLPGGSESVLLVEGDETLRRVTCRTLQRAGYLVLEASGAEQARDQLRGHSGDVALLILDRVQAGGGGQALARELRGLRPDLRRVLYVSGHAGERGSDAPLAAGEHLLARPYTRQTLLRRIRDLLDSSLDK